EALRGVERWRRACGTLAPECPPFSDTLLISLPILARVLKDSVDIADNVRATRGVSRCLRVPDLVRLILPHSVSLGLLALSLLAAELGLLPGSHLRFPLAVRVFVPLPGFIGRLVLPPVAHRVLAILLDRDRVVRGRLSEATPL